MTSKLRELEAEQCAVKSRWMELQNTLEGVLDDIRVKSCERSLLEHGLNRQLRRWEEFTELHQTELSTAKSRVFGTAQRIDSVDYLFHRNTVDLQQDIQRCDTMLSKIESEHVKGASGASSFDRELIKRIVLYLLVRTLAFILIIATPRSYKKNRFSFFMIFIIFIFLSMFWV